MSQPAGVSIPLSLPRQLICDYLHFARQIPTVPVQRRMRLGAVVAARAATGLRPSWCALFTKAYGFVSAATPALRRAYMSFPRPHLYEHPINVASVAIERKFGDEDAVFFAHIRQPETLSLADIDQRLRRFKDEPMESIGDYRRILLMNRFPRPLRRLLWWIGLNVWGRKRAAFLGTSGITVYAGLGAASLHPLSLLTTTLNYGVIDPDGTVDVRLTYDHRVLDGATVARALAELERVLTHEVLAELRYLPAAA
ncbi:MAG TPA: 2-oxo acid dehydrogenase subunit E2 [Gemmataceae bacterium]